MSLELRKSEDSSLHGEPIEGRAARPEALAPALEHAAPAQRIPDILYIMGTGRSGTTILEILLANNPGFSGVGEAKHIFRDAYLRNLPCACGASGQKCELWSSVLQSSGWKKDDCVALARAVEALESHKRFPLLAMREARGVTAEYEEAMRKLFGAVGGVTQSRVVVDSSKYAGRALALARLFPDRVKVLCITRSASGIISAFAKKNEAEQRPKGAFAVAAYFVYVLLCMRFVRARLGDRCLAIRFEDLNRDPTKVLTQVETWSGYSLATTREKLSSGDWFDVGHIVTGNRLRKNGRVKFSPSSAGNSRPGKSSHFLAPLLEAFRRTLGF